MQAPYLNEVKLVCNLAVVPQMALSKKNGRQYANISVRLLFRNYKGEPMEDFIQVMCYDKDAEDIVRFCACGDLLMIDGYLAQYKWVDGEILDTPEEYRDKLIEKNYQSECSMLSGMEQRKQSAWKTINSRIIVVANHVMLLAKGNGKLPDYSAFMKNVETNDELPFANGEDAFISSIVMNAQMERTGYNSPSHYGHYPQPKQDGTWRLPDVPMGQTSKWITKHGLTLEQQLEQQWKFASNYIERNLKKENEGRKENEKALVPSGLPRSVINHALCLLSDNLKKDGECVILPSGKSMKWTLYQGILQKQRERIMAMPKEMRSLVIAAAKCYYGTSINVDKFGIEDRVKTLANDMKGRPVMMRSEVLERIDREQQERENQKRDVITNGQPAYDSNGNIRNMPKFDSSGLETPDFEEMYSSELISGANPDDWYQDENGEWKMKH